MAHGESNGHVTDDITRVTRPYDVIVATLCSSALLRRLYRLLSFKSTLKMLFYNVTLLDAQMKYLFSNFKTMCFILFSIFEILYHRK